MLEFKPLTLGDIETVRPHFMVTHSRLCDYSVGGTVMWRDFFKTGFCVDEIGALYFKTHYLGGVIAFTYPLGCEPETAIEKVVEYCKQNDLPVVFCTISKSQLAFLQQNFSVKSATPERDWFDYLYNASDLINLSGKKFHGQKNFVNRFKRMYPDYRFVEMTNENVGVALDFLRRKFPVESAGDAIEREELTKVFEVFENFDTYGMPGGMVMVGDSVAALAVGEIVNDTLFVHIEKADRDYQGSYQIIVNEFAKHFATDGVEYINREEDVGDEGLRKSKLAYHPVDILEKYTVVLDV